MTTPKWKTAISDNNVAKNGVGLPNPCLIESQIQYLGSRLVLREKSYLHVSSEGKFFK